MIEVAALYVLARGPYSSMPGVDPWPEKRNALCFPGGMPVVAHPPCGPWSRSVMHQTKLSLSQGPWLAPAAVCQVRRDGGLLEHPAESLLWEESWLRLPYPEPYRQRTFAGPERDAWGGFTVELDQGPWADHESPDEHGAHKRSWIYIVGIDPGCVVLLPPAASPPKSSTVRKDKRGGSKSSWVRTRYDMMSPESRKRSPKAFAEWLVGLARTV